MAQWGRIENRLGDNRIREQRRETRSLPRPYPTKNVTEYQSFSLSNIGSQAPVLTHRCGSLSPRPLVVLCLFVKALRFGSLVRVSTVRAVASRPKILTFETITIKKMGFSCNGLLTTVIFVPWNREKPKHRLKNPLIIPKLFLPRLAPLKINDH